jgi:hypothetical protein
LDSLPTMAINGKPWRKTEDCQICKDQTSHNGGAEKVARERQATPFDKIDGQSNTS